MRDAGVSKQRKEKMSSKREQKEKEAAMAKQQAKLTQAQVTATPALHMARDLSHMARDLSHMARDVSHCAYSDAEGEGRGGIWGQAARRQIVFSAVCIVICDGSGTACATDAQGEHFVWKRCGRWKGTERQQSEEGKLPPLRCKGLGLVLGSLYIAKG